MSDANVRLYEGLFLVNPTPINSNLSAALAAVQEVLNRAGAQVLALAKWDERKLAYEIRGAKRGIYILAYFKVDGRKIASIERDVTLSDVLIRCLVIKAEHVGDVELQAALEAQAKTQAAAKLQGEEKPAEAQAVAQPA